MIMTLKKFKEREKQWIEKATKVHGGLYDYSKVVFKGVMKKVEIICPIHGSFFQTPNNHERGSGCPYCNINRFRTTGHRIRR